MGLQMLPNSTSTLVLGFVFGFSSFTNDTNMLQNKNPEIHIRKAYPEMKGKKSIPHGSGKRCCGGFTGQTEVGGVFLIFLTPVRKHTLGPPAHRAEGGVWRRASEKT